MKTAKCYTPYVAPQGNPKAKYIGWYKDTRFADIAQAVIDATGVHPVKFYSKGRKRENVTARMLFAYVCRTDARLTHESIGNHLQKDHSTAVYYVKKAEEILSYDRTVQDQVQQIRKLLYERRNG